MKRKEPFGKTDRTVYKCAHGCKSAIVTSKPEGWRLLPAVRLASQWVYAPHVPIQRWFCPIHFPQGEPAAPTQAVVLDEVHDADSDVQSDVQLVPAEGDVPGASADGPADGGRSEVDAAGTQGGADSTCTGGRADVRGGDDGPDAAGEQQDGLGGPTGDVT